MKTTENICPVCKGSNEIEAVVCGHCGAALEDPFMDPGAKTREADIPVVTSESARDWSINETTVPDQGIAVYIEGNANPMYVDSKGEFVIGRKVGGTKNVSETLLDLSPLGGYGQGISRRHAAIRRAEKGYEILDLGSVNGTWLNNERLTPHQFYPLTSGSHLRLGNMRLFVLYQPLGKVN